MTEREKFFRTRGPWNDPELVELERILANLRKTPSERLRQHNDSLLALRRLQNAKFSSRP